MQVDFRKVLEHCVCIVILALIAFAVLIPEFRGNRFPMSVDAALMFTPWEEARDVGEHIAMDAFDREQVYRYYPWYRHISESSYDQGESAHWYPYEAGGFPLSAIWQARVFSPFSLPFSFFPFERALVVSLFLKIFVAGLCALYTARRFGLMLAPSFLVAVSYALCGGVWVWGIFPVGDIAPWFPLLLLSLERLSFGHGWTWPGGAIVLGLMLLGGEPSMVAAIMLWGGVFLALRIITTTHTLHIFQTLFGWFFLAAIGLGLAAMQWFPFWEFSELGTVDSGLEGASLPLGSTLSILIPQFAHYASFGQLMHVNAVLAVLLGLWLVVQGHVPDLQRHRLEVLLASSLITLAIAYVFMGTPSVIALCPIIVLAVALLGAAALEEWTVLDVDSMHESLPRAQKVLPFAAGTVLVLALLATFYFGAWRQGYELFILSAFYAATVAVLWRTVTHPSIRLSGYLCGALCVLCLIWNNWGASPSTTPERVFPETATLNELKKEQWRITGSERIADWPLSGNGIPQLYAPGGVRLKRYDSFMERVFENPLLLARSGVDPILVDKAMLQDELAILRPELKIVKLLPLGMGYFSIPHGISRARVVFFGETIKVTNSSKIVQGGPTILEGGALPDNDPLVQEGSEINFVKAEAQDIKLDVKSPRDGVLVLCEAWYPGWKARVNGVDRPVFPVDVLFRGVEVDEGENVVEFTFAPESRIYGQMLSAASFGIVLIGYGIWFLYWRRMHKTHPWELEMH